MDNKLYEITGNLFPITSSLSPFNFIKLNNTKL